MKENFWQFVIILREIQFRVKSYYMPWQVTRQHFQLEAILRNFIKNVFFIFCIIKNCLKYIYPLFLYYMNDRCFPLEK
jgi:hypothetical protein